MLPAPLHLGRRLPTSFKDGSISAGRRRRTRDSVFAATAILTLAVCIGVLTAIFTIVHSVLLQPLPVPEAECILLLSNQYPNGLHCHPVRLGRGARHRRATQVDPVIVLNQQ